MISETHYTESGSSPPKAWRKCDHPRTPENTMGACAKLPGGQCRTCRRASIARYDASDQRRAAQARYARTDKGRAAYARYARTDKGRVTSRAANARYVRAEKGRAARAQNHWRDRGTDPSFTWADYHRLLLKQGNRCALCGKPPLATRRLDVDHDHNDPRGRVRGIVHTGCNVVIGRYENGTLKKRASLVRCARYLQRAR